MIDREFALTFDIIIPLVNGIIVALQRLILAYSIGYLMGYTFRCHQSCLAWTIPCQWSCFFLMEKSCMYIYIYLYIHMYEWMKDFPASHVQLPWLISCFIRNCLLVGKLSMGWRFFPDLHPFQLCGWVQHLSATPFDDISAGNLNMTHVP